MTAIAKSAKTHPSNRNFRLFKEFLPKFHEEKEFQLKFRHQTESSFWFLSGRN